MKIVHHSNGKKKTVAKIDGEAIGSVFFADDHKTVVAKNIDGVEKPFASGIVEVIGDDGKTLTKLQAGNG